MDYKKELEKLLKMHDLLKKSDDFYYASYMKDLIKTVKWKLRKAKNENNNC